MWPQCYSTRENTVQLVYLIPFAESSGMCCTLKQGGRGNAQFYFGVITLISGVIALLHGGRCERILEDINHKHSCGVSLTHCHSKLGEYFSYLAVCLPFCALLKKLISLLQSNSSVFENTVRPFSALQCKSIKM